MTAPRYVGRPFGSVTGGVRADGPPTPTSEHCENGCGRKALWMAALKCHGDHDGSPAWFHSCDECLREKRAEVAAGRTCADHSAITPTIKARRIGRVR